MDLLNAGINPVMISAATHCLAAALVFGCLLVLFTSIDGWQPEIRRYAGFLAGITTAIWAWHPYVMSFGLAPELLSVRVSFLSGVAGLLVWLLGLRSTIPVARVALLGISIGLQAIATSISFVGILLLPVLIAYHWFYAADRFARRENLWVSISSLFLMAFIILLLIVLPFLSSEGFDPTRSLERLALVGAGLEALFLPFGPVGQLSLAASLPIPYTLLTLFVIGFALLGVKNRAPFIMLSCFCISSLLGFLVSPDPSQLLNVITYSASLALLPGVLLAGPVFLTVNMRWIYAPLAFAVYLAVQSALYL